MIENRYLFHKLMVDTSCKNLLQERIRLIKIVNRSKALFSINIKFSIIIFFREKWSVTLV